MQLDEEEEIRKILAGLSEQVGAQSRLIDHTVAALAELDLAFAKAKYAEAIGAVEPILFNPDKVQRAGQGSRGRRGEISPASPAGF